MAERERLPDDKVALDLLARHLDIEPGDDAAIVLACIDEAISGLSDDRLDASIRYFGQAGSEATNRAAAILTEFLIHRLARQFSDGHEG